MNKDALLKKWLHEESIAKIHGWDFSHINNRYEEEKDLPWNYYNVVKSYLSKEKRLLDIDTGGGEFLLSLNHPSKNLAATEGYSPNVKLCKTKLLPMGIDFKEADPKIHLPYANCSFDIVINRHGDYNEKEIKRVLKRKGIFITEQVGAENDLGLIELLFSKTPTLAFPEQYLNISKNKFVKLNFDILESQEAYRPIKFYDVGALVWYAHIIEWEFPNFSVKNNLENLLVAQEILNNKGVIQAQIHRYLLVVKKI